MQPNLLSVKEFCLAGKLPNRPGAQGRVLSVSPPPDYQDLSAMAPSERAEGQERWNEIGSARRLDIERNPARYLISACPVRDREFYGDLLELVSPLPGKDLLELGFGRGELSVWLAQQGARVTAVDLGQELVSAAAALAKLNGVSCDFRQGNVSELRGIPPDQFDVVAGIAILHHLPQSEVRRSLSECHRVLKPGGLAVFAEPVENSRWFDLAQNLFPAGRKNSAYYRPSILNRRRWRAYVEALDDRTMTDQELLSASQELFRTARVSNYGLLIRLSRVLGPSSVPPLKAIDRFLFRFLPPLRRYCRTTLAVYCK
jgi:2-polyprenyl-3-methyl-5-hydroxy-6-metoxy-1,4-benzoquinol methylase